jgi:hypothetical protein
VDGSLEPLDSPVYLDSSVGAGGATLTVLVTGPAACAGSVGLVLGTLDGGDWAAALRLPASAGQGGASCPGGQRILQAPAPDALVAQPSVAIVTPPAAALAG